MYYTTNLYLNTFNFHREVSYDLRLKSRIKYGVTSDGPSTRTNSTEDTLMKVIPICRQIGVTRVSNITHMDRLNIPNYSAVLPGTEDVIWVYGGKGPTRSHAKASALMEAIERHSSLSGSCERAFIQGNYLELSKSYCKVIHPDEVVEPVNQEFDEKKTILNYLAGFDLLSHEEVLVPAGLALYMHTEIKSPAISVFPSFHTNGLASGNAIEEAICHALCEVIEIDAVSIADLCASCIPYNILETIADSIKRRSLSMTLILLVVHLKIDL